MKRLLTSAAMFLCSLLTFAQGGFSGSGSGTENDPYLILNPIQLNQMRNYLNKEEVYFKLMVDVDLTDFLEDENPSQGWQPIGTSSTPFKGILDGNGKTVSGLWINRPNSEYIGFFGNLDGGTVKDLTLNGTNINGSSFVGLLSGSGGLVVDCTISGSVNGTSYIGGCVGRYGTITRVSSTVDVSGSGNYVGGISGEGGSFDNCKVINKFVRGENFVGGICGVVDNKIIACYAYTDVSGADNVGGICGQANYHSSVIKCGYWGNLSADSYAGGICGKYIGGNSHYVHINECSAIGNIDANGDYVGGIVGLSDSGGVYSSSYNYVTNCYYNGYVSGNEYVGGLVGFKNKGCIKNCYANATINGVKTVGGICGKIYGNAYGVIELQSNASIMTSIKATDKGVSRIFVEKEGDRFNIGEIGTKKENKALNRAIVIEAGVAKDVTDNEQNGTGVSATTLKLKATYVAMDWDFSDTWEIQETECYPYFKTQTAPPVITSKLVSGATTISGKCVDGGTVIIEIDGVKQQRVSKGQEFSFTVSPLQAGHEVRISAKAEGKEQSYFTTETVQYLGSGKENDPYQIYTASDLTGVYRKGYFKLMNDIDLTDYINQFSPTEGWQSIGREGSETIHFDGDGHKITGFWCNSTRDNTGLFSCFANGYIKNLTVETANGKQVKGGNCTGIIIGKLINGEMTNCKVTGSLADGTPVGGLMGKLEGGKVSRCQADVTINVSGENSYIGGLIGEVNGEVDQCLSYGTLTATGKNSYVGGLVGISNSGSTISNGYSSAVTNSSLSASGIVAYNYGIVDKCYAVGNVFSKNYGAGVVGYNDGEGAIVKNCVAMNNKLEVTFESQSAQSGGYGQRIIGGIKNSAPAPEMNNYALKTMQVSVNNVAQKVYDDIMNGTAKTAAQLKAKATYEELGWDFESIWKIEEGTTYPYQTEIIAAGESGEPDNPDDPGTISVTDVSNLTNAIYAQPTSSQPGYETTLTICLKNAQAATAYSFDLQLPDGVSLATKSNGDYQCMLSNRHNGHQEVVNYITESGVYSFAILSLQSNELNGNDGTVLTLRLKVSDKVVNGDYAIKILNAKYSIASGSASVNMPETISKLTINQYKKGDVNNDGNVDIADAVCIVNHVVGIATPSFVAQAADANGDGSVDISDAVRIINLIVGKIQTLSRGNSSLSRTVDQEENATDAITVDDLSLYTGSEGELTVSLKNSQTTNAYSFDIELPDGVSLVQDEDGKYQEGVSYNLSERHNGHTPIFNYIGNNTYSLAILSIQSKELSGNDGAICTFKIKVAQTAAGGKRPVKIKNAKYSLTSGASSVIMSDTEGQLTVKKLGDANGDGELNETDRSYIIRHIMGDTPDDFVEEAANLNGDDKIDVADIVLLNQLLGENPSSLP